MTAAVGVDALPVAEQAAAVGAADVLVALHGAAVALGALVRPGGALLDASPGSDDGEREDPGIACAVWGLSRWRPAPGAADGGVSAAALAEAVLSAAVDVLGSGGGSGGAAPGPSASGGLPVRVCPSVGFDRDCS